MRLQAGRQIAVQLDNRQLVEVFIESVLRFTTVINI
jgi:hypothetical protein